MEVMLRHYQWANACLLIMTTQENLIPSEGGVVYSASSLSVQKANHCLSAQLAQLH